MTASNIDIIGILAAILVMIFVIKLVFIINSSDNSLEWSHLISSRAADGIQYADWNKIGQGCGIILCLWLPAVYVYSDKMDAIGLAAVMGVALAYLGSVSGYAATLRARRGTTETTLTTESPSKTTEKKLETPPTYERLDR